MNERNIVLYHADCANGFGGAWAAWKHFGQNAEYRPMRYVDPHPTDFAGSNVYFIDFCYDKDDMLAYEGQAKTLVVIDHHAGVREAIEAVKEHVFDSTRAAAALTWEYFNPSMPLPKLLNYVEDGDLWRYVLPHSKELSRYLSVVPFDFEAWDRLARQIEDPELFNAFIARGAAYEEYFQYAVEKLAHNAELVQFDEYKILAVNVTRLYRSEVAHVLSKWQPPFGMAYYKAGSTWHFTMRGDGVIDLSAIARKHGGNGHHNAAGFRLPRDAPFPFKTIQGS